MTEGKKSISPIRHIAPSHRAIVATALFEKTVQIWDLERCVKVAEFDTVLDFGGRRLVIDHEGKYCVAAAYHVNGIACYDVKNGGLCWQHQNLKKAQVLTVSRDGNHVFCGFDDKSCMMLDVRSGKEVAKYRGVKAVYESPYQPLRLLDKMKPEITADDGTRILNLKRLTFAFLAVSFAPDCFCISEAGGYVRCFDLNSRVERWRYIPTQGSQILRLEYSDSTGFHYGVEWPYQHGGDKKLIRFNPWSGETDVVCNLGQPSETEFCQTGYYLLTSMGDLIDLVTGEAVKRLPFREIKV
jgi:hypothetical protein